MTRARVVYHVGAHKTGTSLVQKFMRDRRHDLSRQGIYYVSRSAMNDFVGWGRPLLERPEAFSERLSEVADSRWYDTVVVSHENTLGRPIDPEGAHLYPRTPDLAAALHGVIGPFDPVVLLYLRPQEEFLESYYLQLIHQGNYFTFEEWFSSLSLDRLSWRPVVEALQGAFGAERVQVVDFHLIKQGQARFIADFLHRAKPGVEIDTEYKPIRNASIGDRGLAMALSANPHLKNGAERKAMRVFLQKHFSNVKYPRPRLLDDAMRSELRSRYAEEYQALVGAPAGASR